MKTIKKKMLTFVTATIVAAEDAFHRAAVGFGYVLVPDPIVREAFIRFLDEYNRTPPPASDVIAYAKFLRERSDIYRKLEARIIGTPDPTAIDFIDDPGPIGTPRMPDLSDIELPSSNEGRIHVSLRPIEVHLLPWYQEWLKGPQTEPAALRVPAGTRILDDNASRLGYVSADSLVPTGGTALIFVTWYERSEGDELVDPNNWAMVEGFSELYRYGS